MYVKVIGAVLIISGCGVFGFSLASNYRKEEQALLQLLGILNYMECELQYRLTPLPNLCAQAAKEARGEIAVLMRALSKELDDQVSPDVRICMDSALHKVKNLPKLAVKHLQSLGDCLGRFDLTGQLRGLDFVRSGCRNDLEALKKNRDVRLRNYETLGLCAGAALAILLI